MKLSIGQRFLNPDGMEYMFIEMKKPNTYTRNPTRYGLLNLKNGIAIGYLNDVFTEVERDIERLELVPFNALD
jgi:hypothetical protein